MAAKAEPKEKESALKDKNLQVAVAAIEKDFLHDFLQPGHLRYFYGICHRHHRLFCKDLAL